MSWANKLSNGVALRKPVYILRAIPTPERPMRRVLLDTVVLTLILGLSFLLGLLLVTEGALL